MRSLFTLLLSGLFCFSALSQDKLADNEYYYSLVNKLDLLIIKDKHLQQPALNLTFKTGTIIEKEQQEGWVYLHHLIFTASLEKHLKTEGLSEVVQFKNSIDQEKVSYTFSFPKAQYKNLLTVLFKTLTATKFDSVAVQKARAQAEAQYQELMTSAVFRLSKQTSELLWENFYYRRSIYHVPDSLPANLPEQLQQLHKDFYCPRNAFMIIKGDLTVKSTLDQAKDAFSDWLKCYMDPFVRYPVPQPWKLRFSRQIIDTSGYPDRPFFIIAFQAPVTFDALHDVYASKVLSRMLADPKSRIYHEIKDSTFIDSLSLYNEMHYYASETYFYLQADSNHSKAHDQFWALISNDTLLTDEDVERAKQYLISNFNQSKQTIGHLEVLSDYWTSAGIDDYTGFEAAMGAITREDVLDMVKDHVLGDRYLAGLAIDPKTKAKTNIDSLFAETKENVRAYRFHFLRNTGTLSNQKERDQVNSLMQFLNINDDVRIKVNGMAERSELLQIKDNALHDFLNELDHFLMNPPSLIETRRFRLDVYRSLTIIKSLIEAGISEYRLFGTGHLVQEAEDKAARKQNQIVYCTLMQR